MTEIEAHKAFNTKHPEVWSAYVEFYADTGEVVLDGRFTPAQLRSLAELVEGLATHP